MCTIHFVYIFLYHDDGVLLHVPYRMVMARSPKSIVRPPIRLLVVHTFTTLNNARYALLGSLGTPKRRMRTSSKQKGARHAHIVRTHVSDYFSYVVFEHGENRRDTHAHFFSSYPHMLGTISISIHTERVVVVMLMVWINKMFCNESSAVTHAIHAMRECSSTPYVTLVLYSCRVQHLWLACSPLRAAS